MRFLDDPPQQSLNTYELIKLFPLYILINSSKYSVSLKSPLYGQKLDLHLDVKLDTNINLYWHFLWLLQ